jgi:ribosome-binding protein aMBF1 (putative translation factor)
MSHQDWNTVTFNKPKSLSNNSKVVSQGISRNEYTVSNKELPKALQQARQAKNMTQKDLCIKLNIQTKDLNDWERGASIPSNQVIANISKELGVQLPRNRKTIKETE